MRVRHVQGRRFPLRRIAPRRLLVRRHADLVAPVDFGPFPLGPRLDGRVGLLQPLPHFLGVLIAGVAARPLGREAPALQIAADGPHRQIEVELLADQVADGAAGPQRRRDAQLLGLVGAQELLEVFGLGVGEGAARTQAGVRCGVGEGVQAAVGVGGPPAADGLAGDAEEVGDLDLGEAQFAAAQGTQAEGFQDVIG